MQRLWIESDHHLCGLDLVLSPITSPKYHLCAVTCEEDFVVLPAVWFHPVVLPTQTPESITGTLKCVCDDDYGRKVVLCKEG